MTSNWKRVQQVFNEALSRSAEECAGLLDEACGNDAELRAEVESLLEHDRQAPGDFLKPPEPHPRFIPPDDDGPDPLIGAHVGKYEIKSVIARGGMGTVYEAEQEQPRRIVALKVMKRHVASGSALRRFQFESEILARLRHPNIAQVYEAGVHHFDTSRDREGTDPLDAVPYFAMEYIAGAQPITRYAAEQRLDIRRRLRLFADVCDAVHHGHQKGVIHRDLKPANILVAQEGSVGVPPASGSVGVPPAPGAADAPVGRSQSEPGAQQDFAFSEFMLLFLGE